MILIPSQKLCFVSTPKCATNTMYDLLPQAFPDAVRQTGPFHVNKVPKSAADYEVFTVVRNPYDRALSCWASTTKRKDERYVPKRMLNCTFKGYLRWLWEAKPTKPVHQSQTQWLQGVKLDWFFKLEELEASANQRLPALRKLEWRCLNKSDKPEHEWDEQERQMVQDWDGPAFERFGYDR